MDSANTRWLDTFIEDCFREDSDRRDEFEEPWHWTSTPDVEDLGDWEDVGYDIRRAERMVEAMYEC